MTTDTMTRPDTLVHARNFLRGVDSDYRLFQTARSFIATSPKIREWNELRDWCLERVKNIAGTTSVEHGLRHPDVRTLMAVGYMAFVQSPPSIPSTPTRALLKNIESDFFSVLLRETKATANLLPSFKERLEQAEHQVTQLIRRLGDTAASTTAEQHPESARTLARSDDGGGGWAIIGFVAVVLAVLEVCDQLKNKN